MQILNSLSSHLTSLKMEFDNAIMHGESFHEVKKIYLQIKVLEKKIAERQIRTNPGGKN